MICIMYSFNHYISNIYLEELVIYNLCSNTIVPTTHMSGVQLKNLIERGNALAEKDATHHNAKLLPDKGFVINKLVVCRTFDRVIMYIISQLWFRDKPK